MNTRDLEYFQSLCEIKNFSQVATRFGVSQPTITMALKRLEEHFGIQLIDRDQSHASITVTPAGETLAAHVRVITQQLTMVEAELARARDTKIQFGLPPIIGRTYFPQLAPGLLQAGLMEQLHTKESGSARLLEELRAGHLDVALLGSSGPLDAPALTVLPLATFPFMIAMAKSHPLAKAESLSFAELQEEPFVTLSEGFVHTKAMTWFTHKAGIHPSVVYRTPDVTLLKQMVQANVGVALLAELAVTPSDDLAVVPLSDPGQPAFDISLVTGRAQTKSRALTELMTLIQTETRQQHAN